MQDLTSVDVWNKYSKWFAGDNCRWGQEMIDT